VGETRVPTKRLALRLLSKKDKRHIKSSAITPHHTASYSAYSAVGANVGWRVVKQSHKVTVGMFYVSTMDDMMY
jgi:hypothetical protein